ncbi:hypothetical protein E2986_11060 [Frieseomelitta varia]|uniref:WAP domain-containing protein n=1 Tax=Frieseomelitta varia TaxID=561572 RepID=A0A833VQM0_9HYME|nr:hypothetical protein E2986_11060 [Frieseomelitta varia]
MNKEGHCPLRNSISKCSPRCVSDFQCSFNKKCCPNKCGSDSCAPASAVSTGNGYKGSSDGNVYCAGIKCGPLDYSASASQSFRGHNSIFAKIRTNRKDHSRQENSNSNCKKVEVRLIVMATC